MRDRSDDPLHHEKTFYHGRVQGGSLVYTILMIKLSLEVF